VVAGVFLFANPFKAGEKPPVPVTSATVAATGGVRATSKLPGVKMYVDDKEAGELPHEVKDLAPGDHQIRFEAGPAYAIKRQTVSVKSGDVNDLGTIALPLARGSVVLHKITPDGAEAIVTNGTVSQPLGVMPVDVDPSGHWEVVVKKAGYEEYRQPLDFSDGVATKSIDVTLKAATRPAGPAAAPAVARDCVNDRIDPKTDKVRAECIGK
jgi:hypothetical protein